MTVQQIATTLGFEILSGEESLSRSVEGIYCCDLLSFVMGRAPADFAWLTVMGNINAAAVASLADVACVVLVDGVLPDAPMLEKAQQQDIAVLAAPGPAFETGLAIDQLLEA
ncbi:MAG: hypothetical protein IJL66_00280 [Lachnospiraceae bacterium]|nr:hypothetical protein [Lachnospiraceae bacterium]